jgi:hypothetical protein
MSEKPTPSREPNQVSTTSASWFCISIWAVLSLGWIARDKMVPDGDEQGHIGAAELFFADLSSGNLLGFTQRIWWDQMGEYPQAFTAGVGMWWWLMDGGQPGRTPVRGICLLSLVIAAIAVGRITRRYTTSDKRDLAQVISTVLVLCIPLANGVTRHFMPEGALIAAVAVTILMGHRLVEHPTLWRGVQLGVFMGLGLLTKQTFILMVALPLGCLLTRLRTQSILPGGAAILAAAVIAGPWMAHNSTDQLTYGMSSWGGHGDAGFWQHLAYYPTTTIWLGLGPILALATIVAVVHLFRAHDKRVLILGAVWLLGGIILLTLVPKKYPRLLAPLLPVAAIWIAIAIVKSQTPIRWMVSTATLALTWLIITSTIPVPLSVASNAIDPGCPQSWLRPPDDRDLGLERTAHVLKEMPDGPILVIDAPSIPCTVQTTHDWIDHLRPYLRRNGDERAVHQDPSLAHSSIIDWAGGAGEEIDVPALSTSLSIRAKLAP